MTRSERLFIERMTPAQRDAEIVEKLLDIIAALSGGGTTTMEAIGSIKAWPSATLPDDWLLCYGQELALATYPDLGALLGTTYGALTDGAGGAGSTHFRVPDLRGRVIAGQDDMGGTSANRLTGSAGGPDGDTLGGAGGEEAHQLTILELPGHNHGINAIDDGISGGNEVLLQGVSGGNTVTTADEGGDQAHNVVQPTIILNWIIKVL